VRPAITVFQVPVTLTSMMSRNDSCVISFHGAGTQIPALATMTSSRPKAFTPSSTAACSAARSRMSAAVAMIRPPAASTNSTVSLKSFLVADG
jgi:hypothetical protein